MLVGAGRDGGEIGKTLPEPVFSLSTAVFAATFSFAMMSAGRSLARKKQAGSSPAPSKSGSPGFRRGRQFRQRGEPHIGTDHEAPFTSFSLIGCATDAAASQTPSICPRSHRSTPGAAPR